MTAATRTLRTLWSFLNVAGPLRAELNELSLRGARARTATITALSVTLATIIALLGHMDMPWWAAMSGFMSVQTTRPASIQRVILRIAGTAVGAAAGLVLAPWLVRDPIAGTLGLSAAATLSVIGFLVSPHGYAWLFFGITLILVILMSVGDPSMALHYAVYRFLEVVAGSISALVVVLLLGADVQSTSPPATPGWHHLLDADWPKVLHAIRAGITIAVLPWAWSFFELPDLTQMVVTVAAVMAVPVLSDHAQENGRVVAQRVVHRCIGCFLGGITALLALSASISSFIPWVLILAAGVWVGAHVQGSTRGVGYIGTQATVVWIMTLVQGFGPPDSIMPGVNRFAGIMAGVVILLIVSLLLWPEEETVRLKE